MKKLALGIISAFLLLSFVPLQLNAVTTDSKVLIAAAKASPIADDAAQLARLEEIKAMDMSTLSRSEKKELRNEVRAIKSDQDGRGRRYHDGRGGSDYNGRHSGGTVYFMGGGGILIILLIILLI